MVGVIHKYLLINLSSYIVTLAFTNCDFLELSLDLPWLFLQKRTSPYHYLEASIGRSVRTKALDFSLALRSLRMLLLKSKVQRRCCKGTWRYYTSGGIGGCSETIMGELS